MGKDSLDEILNDLVNAQFNMGVGAKKEEAKAALLAYFTALVPEKRVNQGSTPATSQLSGTFIEGWNACREQMLKAIKEKK